MNSKHLRPYQSFHLFRHGELPSSGWEKELKGLTETFFNLLAGASDETNTVVQPPTSEAHPSDIRTSFLTYKKEINPIWAAEAAGLRDVENHVLLIVAVDDHVAVTTSDKSLAGRIDRFRPASASGPLAHLVRPDPRVLESALVKGKARILWMSAIHRDQAIRPNAKVLIGSNLVASLDALGDQTFHYTSVRCDGPKSGKDSLFGRAVPGVSPRKGRVWLRPSADLDDFLTNSKRLLNSIAAAKVTKQLPFPILASPVTNLSGVEQAFDCAVLPPEFSDGDESLRRTFDIASEVEWKVQGTNSPSFQLHFRIGGEDFTAQVDFSVDKGEVALHIDLPGASKPLPAPIEASIDLIRSDAFKVYYDSGHTFSGRSVYEVTTRPVEFSRFATDKFSGVDITLEKPTKASSSGKAVADLSKIGAVGEPSLFTWAFKRWKKGNLWCDDGSGEIADFIHFRDGTLTLIHLKAAKSDDPARKVAVSPYEVVCAQALKNIRMLEARDLVAELGAKVLKRSNWKRAWRDGKPVTGKSAIPAAINKTRYSALKRRVVIVQPHVMRRQLPKILASTPGPTTAELRRALQLHTMLNGFAANFTNLDIELEVIISP